MISIILFTIFALLAGGCAPNTQLLDQNTLYPRDMLIIVDGQKYDGSGVLPKKASYEIEVNAKGKLDLFTVTSCHREQIIEKAGKSGWFGDKKRVDVSYAPVQGLEDQPACALQFGGYEADKGRHSWGFLDFEDDQNKLGAQLSCNGWKTRASGVSVCQARTGLIQRIEFTSPVKAYASAECGNFKGSVGLSFEFPMPKGECIFGFKELSTGNTHRMTTLGYESVLIRQ